MGWDITSDGDSKRLNWILEVGLCEPKKRDSGGPRTSVDKDRLVLLESQQHDPS